MGTLKNEEEGHVPYPELQEKADDEKGEEEDEEPAFLKQGTIMRRKTIKETTTPDGKLDMLAMGRNKSEYQKAVTPAKNMGVLSPKSEPESLGLLE